MTSASDPTSPTLRQVAEAAGVSAMTVSRALRNLGKVSPRVRAHVQEVARRLRYRPDPAIAKLMHHLRTRRKPAFQASICALTTLPPDRHNPYFEQILNGARRRSEELGYAFELFHLPGRSQSPATLQRILRSRGVEGILLLPMAVTGGLANRLDWREFSVVATTLSVTTPDVQRVLPHHFANTLLLCRQLTERGYRRIGLALPSDQDRRVGHAFTAATNWHNLNHGSQVVTPHIFDELRGDALQRWFEEQQPDVVVVNEGRAAQGYADLLGLRMRGRVGFAGAYAREGSVVSGIDELPSEIGATAAAQLASMIHRNEKGTPAQPTSTMILGKWVPGRTCAPRR